MWTGTWRLPLILSSAHATVVVQFGVMWGPKNPGLILTSCLSSEVSDTKRCTIMTQEPYKESKARIKVIS